MVVVKTFKSYTSIRERNLVSKEASLLTAIKNKNIIRVFGSCEKPSSLMLELCEFSFQLFDSDFTCNNLAQFLEYLHDTSCFESFIPKVGYIIAENITSAVNYLHQKNMVHRDIKPQNCLVTNLLYSQKSVLDTIFKGTAGM